MARTRSAWSGTEGYDYVGETRRLAFRDVIVGEHRLNRGTATVSVHDVERIAGDDATRAAWQGSILPTTLPGDAPVVHLGWPTHGPFVRGPQGVYFDAYLGVAQKVLDEHHPRFRRMLDALDEQGLLLRREIATDDYLAATEAEGVKTPRDLAALWAGALQARWARPGGWKAFFSSSGAEAIEAALKILCQRAYKRFVERFGIDVLRRVAVELGARDVPYFDGDPGLPGTPVFDDYPFQIVACEGAFHGRTLGALSATWSKRAHRLGYPRAWQVRHVPYNDAGDPVRDLVDTRGIEELLAEPGLLARVVREQGRIPKDLFAGFLAEPFQGEGGYLPGDPGFFARTKAVCEEHDAWLVVDEVQSVARTGRLLMTEHLGITPDIVATAKSMVIGITMAPGEVSAYCHDGWHSNTWGSGRVLDTNFAWTTLDTLMHHVEPAFEGRDYITNTELKGAYLAAGLDRLAEQYPQHVTGQRGLGLMRALLVKDRNRVVEEAWRHGLKLLGCGWSADVAPIRLLMLADTTTREVDELLRVLDVTFRGMK